MTKEAKKAHSKFWNFPPIKFIGWFMDNVMYSNVAANAGMVSYMLILSFFPFFIFVFALLKNTLIPEELLINATDTILPESFHTYLHDLIGALYRNASVSIVSITIVMAVWLGSRATLAIIVGLDKVYGIKTMRKYIPARLQSMLYTVLFAFLILFSLTALVFGNSLLDYFAKEYPNAAPALDLINSLKSYISYFAMFLLFLIMYRFIPNHQRAEGHHRRVTFIDQIPGALISVFFWGVYSYIYSIFIRHNYYASFYGTMTTIALLMVWLYFCMYIFFVGGLINSLLYKYKFFRGVKLFILKHMRKRRLLKKAADKLAEKIEEADKIEVVEGDEEVDGVDEVGGVEGDEVVDDGVEGDEVVEGVEEVEDNVDSKDNA
ncbi:MAG: YihY/virulence factor BrkB family protein [Lachnospiraceae bacterium]|nr:YihY/virulence factor BrkB family protein [Lachnospiraceae bacterium]